MPRRWLLTSLVLILYQTNCLSAVVEVVGAEGRVGSLFLRGIAESRPVIRGLAAGAWSEPSCPIVVATPSASWPEIYQQTPDARREDLLWVGNGLPIWPETSVVVPHFGVLEVGGTPVTNQQSPPTYIYGRHASFVALFLSNCGIRVQVVDQWDDIQTMAARKLLWASLMWLLCHEGDQPMPVSQVHVKKEGKLVALVEELLPVLHDLTGKLSSLDETLSYLRAYSLSMPEAIPSKELAMGEIRERNAVWLAKDFAQPLHRELLVKVAGQEALHQALGDTPSDLKKQLIHFEDLKIALSGHQSNAWCQSAVVIGAGIMGTSLALKLAQEGLAVTALDHQPADRVGVTTPASWAWLNANLKQPLSYQCLNQLGMLGWRRDTDFASFPTWNGALVQFKQQPVFLGGYEVEGPLSKSRIEELEPMAAFDLDAGPVYFFPDEGCVDPSLVVAGLRGKARRHGVTFVMGKKVINLKRSDEGRVFGVVCEDGQECLADVVVVAAGTGSALPALGSLPLCHSPGQIAFARPTAEAHSADLMRILVDTVRQSHILQRPDGTRVAGGGFLEIGGSTSTSASGRLAGASDTDRGQQLIDVARQLAPRALDGAVLIRSEKAVRPIPKDGAPALGYLEPGLYAAVTHSAFTLAPIVATAIAAEVAHGVHLDILERYRPARLYNR